MINELSPLLLQELRHQASPQSDVLHDGVPTYSNLNAKDYQNVPVQSLSFSCMLRREKEWTINENRCDPYDYHRNIQIAREKLEVLLNVPESSAIFA